jgi:hypothetical protein
MHSLGRISSAIQKGIRTVTPHGDELLALWNLDEQRRIDCVVSSILITQDAPHDPRHISFRSGGEAKYSARPQASLSSCSTIVQIEILNLAGPTLQMTARSLRYLGSGVVNRNFVAEVTNPTREI